MRSTSPYKTMLMVLCMTLLVLVASANNGQTQGHKEEDNIDRGRRHHHHHHRRQLARLDPVTVQVKEFDFTEQAKLTELGQKPLYNPYEPDPWKRELFQRLDRVRAVCGELCAINNQESLEKHLALSDAEENKDNKFLKAQVDCPAILSNADMDAQDTDTHFPPPDELIPYYSMEGLVDFKDGRKFNDRSSSADKPIVWTESLVASYIRNCETARQQIYPPFGGVPDTFHDRIQKYIGRLDDKRILIISADLNPWVEAVALHLGAPHVTTILYGGFTVDNQHPQITTLTPHEFRRLHGNRKDDQQQQQHPWYDVVLAFSSLDHPGLGRQGEALNPWLDLLTLARVRCVTTPNGHLAIAVPGEKDSIRFNEGRSYGPNRLPLLTANWIQTDQDEHRHDHRGHGHNVYVYKNSNN